ANVCQACTPATSTTAWSSANDGTSCATGQVCSSGTCSADCFIGGALYTVGTVNPVNVCQVCAPAIATTAWTSKSDGTSCGSGSTCVGGTCTAGISSSSSGSS